MRELRWCKVIKADGSQEWLMRPARSGHPYDAFRRHKLAMLQGQSR